MTTSSRQQLAFAYRVSMFELEPSIGRFGVNGGGGGGGLPVEDIEEALMKFEVTMAGLGARRVKIGRGRLDAAYMHRPRPRARPPERPSEVGDEGR